MKYTSLHTIKAKILQNKWWFAGVVLTLFIETGLSLFVPRVLSIVLNNLEDKSRQWLWGITAFFFVAVMGQAAAKILNTWLSEKLGWRLCDHLRENLFEHIMSFSVRQHKAARAGVFLERLEGDVNILVNFLSNMFVDILGSLLMVIGILLIFFSFSIWLGMSFTVLAIAILLLFVKTQNPIAGLWKTARDAETEILGEISQDIAASQDIVGMGKTEYILNRLAEKFDSFEKKQVRASFLGNIPATVFYSTLNVGEGLVLLIGIFLMDQGYIQIGDLFLFLSYATLLNYPFYSLKYEFSQLPQAFAALARIEEIYAEPIETIYSLVADTDEKGGEITFAHVSFSYAAGNEILHDISFQIKAGERAVIEGRTGSGKSTILQLIAGFYQADSGRIKIKSQQGKGSQNGIYYIMQSHPVMEDSIRNNISQYEDCYEEEALLEALKKSGLDEWMAEKKLTLDSYISGQGVSADIRQRLAWAGALLEKPSILLVDEFDADIQDSTMELIDEIITKELRCTTIVMVTHRHRSSSRTDKHIFVDAGHIERIAGN